MGKKKSQPAADLDTAETCAAWSLMLWEQTVKALDAEHGAGFADEHPEVVAMCMQAGSAALVANKLGRLGRVLTGLE